MTCKAAPSPCAACAASCKFEASFARWPVSRTLGGKQSEPDRLENDFSLRCGPSWPFIKRLFLHDWTKCLAEGEAAPRCRVGGHVVVRGKKQKNKPRETTDGQSTSICGKKKSSGLSSDWQSYTKRIFQSCRSKLGFYISSILRRNVTAARVMHDNAKKKFFFLINEDQSACFY